MAEDKKTADQGNDDKRKQTEGAAAAASSSPGTERGTSGKTEPAAKSKAGKSSASKAGGARPPRRRGRRWLSLLLILLVIVAAGYYGWRYYGDELSARLGIDLPDLAGAREETSEPDDPEPSAPEPEKPAEGESQPGPAAPETPPASSAQPAPDAEEEVADQAGAEDAASAEALAAVEKRLGEVERRLQHQRTRLEELAGTTRRDWLLAEAEYLLRLAHQRILTERRAANALALMETVDGILEELDDPELFPVRRALAREITRLRGAEDLDREGIFLELETLIESAEQLEIPRPAEPAEPTAPQPETEAPWYRQLLDNAREALVSLSGIVRVERLDAPPPPLPTPSETERLRQSVRLALEQAQLGLMREHQAIFDASIERAREMVSEHFADTETGATMLTQLDELAETRVTRSLPTPDASLRALRDYVRLQHDRYEAGGGNGS